MDREIILSIKKELKKELKQLEKQKEDLLLSEYDDNDLINIEDKIQDIKLEIKNLK